MSYDFMMFKPRHRIEVMDDIKPENLAQQMGDDVKILITRLFPSTEWENRGDRGWFGQLTADGDWYEFRIHSGEDECWTIATSEGNPRPELVTKICAALRLLAFDGQSLELIDGNGRRPAN